MVLSTHPVVVQDELGLLLELSTRFHYTCLIMLLIGQPTLGLNRISSFNEDLLILWWWGFWGCFGLVFFLNSNLEQGKCENSNQKHFRATMRLSAFKCSSCRIPIASVLNVV